MVTELYLIINYETDWNNNAIYADGFRLYTKEEKEEMDRERINKGEKPLLWEEFFVDTEKMKEQIENDIKLKQNTKIRESDAEEMER